MQLAQDQAIVVQGFEQYGPECLSATHHTFPSPLVSSSCTEKQLKLSGKLFSKQTQGRFTHLMKNGFQSILAIKRHGLYSQLE